MLQLERVPPHTAAGVEVWLSALSGVVSSFKGGSGEFLRSQKILALEGNTDLFQS